MKKVCHVTCVHSSGDTRIFHKECCSLARNGYQVWLVAPGESREEEGVHIRGIGPKPAGTLNRLRAGMAGKAYRAALELDCQVYHIHDPELLPYARKLAGKGKKVIFDSHEDYAQQVYERGYFPGPLRKTAAGLYTAMETWAIRPLQAVVVPSTKLGKDIFEGRSRRTVFLDNLPEAGRFPAPEPFSPDSANAVGYVGGITQSRGITQLVKACHAAQARLRLGGPVWPSYRQELEAMPEYACVEYEGVLPYDRVPAFCRSFRVGACVLLDQGQYWTFDNINTKVYEYMGAGLPVIVSGTRAARRLAEEYDCCLCVDPENTEEVARAIRTLLDDPERAWQMGQNGYRAVMETFNWSREEEKLLALYRDLTE